MFLAFPLMSL